MKIPVCDPFAEWFFPSKVVDRRGQPLLVYHGSPHGPSPAFGNDSNQTPKINDGRPFFVTDNFAYAQDFAHGGKVTSLYVRLVNPADLSDPDLVEELLAVMRSDPAAHATLAVMNDPQDASDVEGSSYFLLESPMVMAHLKARGFDGAVMDEDLEKGVTSYAAFYPEQVKHASRCQDPWFFDSKVTTPDGAPLVVFHGTNAHAYSEGEIESFITQPASGRGGAFFTSDRSLAAQYGERVYEVHLSLKNPLVVEGDGKSWGSMSADTRIEGSVPEALRLASQKDADALTTLFAEMDELFAVEGDAVAARPKIPASATTLAARTLGDIPGLAGEGLETDAIVKTARKMGFDGVVFRNVQDSPTSDPGYSKVLADVYVAFDHRQIRHVVQNLALEEPKDKACEETMEKPTTSSIPEPAEEKSETTMGLTWKPALTWKREDWVVSLDQPLDDVDWTPLEPIDPGDDLFAIDTEVLKNLSDRKLQALSDMTRTLACPGAMAFAQALGDEAKAREISKQVRHLPSLPGMKTTPTISDPFFKLLGGSPGLDNQAQKKPRLH